MQLHNMSENGKRKKDSRLVSSSGDSRTLSRFEIHQNMHQNRRNQNLKDLRSPIKLTRSNSDRSGSLNDDFLQQTFIVSKMDDRPMVAEPDISRQSDQSTLSVKLGKCQWTAKKKTNPMFGLFEQARMTENLNEAEAKSKQKQQHKDSAIRRDDSEPVVTIKNGKDNRTIPRKSVSTVKLERTITKNLQKDAEFINEKERDLLANYRIVAELFGSSKQQYSNNFQSSLRERKYLAKYKASATDDTLKKNRVIKQNSRRKLKRSATINVETRNFNQESSKLLTKRTYIEQSFCPKDLQWKTNLVKINTLTSNDDKGRKKISGNEFLLNDSDERNEIIVQGYVEDDNNLRSKQHISSRENPQMTTSFRESGQTGQSRKLKDTEKNKYLDRCESYDYNDNYKASLYNNPSSLSSNDVKQASVYSDRFDTASGFSKVNLTKSSSSSSSQSPSLRISIGNLRMIFERNLVATLVGAYILVSLTIIMILMLPYLFNFHPETIDNRVSEDILKAASTSSHEQTHKINDPTLDLNIVGMNLSKINALEMTQVVTESDIGTKLIHELEIKKETLYKSEQQVGNNKRESIPLTIEKQFVSGKVDKINQNQQEIQDRPQNTRKRGTRVSLIKGDGIKTTNTQPTKMAKDKFNGWWNVAHNFVCQPLTVPFCNKSPQVTNSNGNQQHTIGASIPYDKTLLPNQFSFAKQSQVERVLQRYEPIIDIKCYSLMPLFLCSIYAPKCIKLNETQVDRHFITQPFDLDTSDPSNEQEDSESFYFANQLAMALKRPIPTTRLTDQRELKPDNWSRLVPPCRSLCKEAFRKCLFFFEVLSLKLLDPEDCNSLPESSNPNICVGQQEYEYVKRTVKALTCPDDKFRCSDGECISKKWRCDGFADCTDKSDEEKCSRCNPTTQFYCGQDLCINKERVCNGISDCRDGRDERQCLRLNSISTETTEISKLQQPNYGQGRLEVWSALKDSWIPVCGTHWSPSPMSHEACQALGYSRANKTLILFTQTTSAEIIATKTIPTNSRVTNGQINYNRRLLGIESDNNSSLTRLAAIHFVPGNYSPPPISDSSSKLLSPKSIPGALFKVAPSPDSSYQSSIDANGEMTATDSEELVEIVEDMASLGNRLNKSIRSDHLVIYDRATSSINNPLSPKLTSSFVGSTKSSNADRAVDLSKMYANEIKLKSLTSMLYHGPESGCVGRESPFVSTVNLECQNFQCGRPYTSYTSRVRLQQQQQLKQQIQQQQAPISGSSKRVQPISRSFAPSTEQSASDSIEESDQTTEKRIKTLEATEELNSGDLDEGVTRFGASSISSDSLISISSRLVVGGTESIPGEFPYLGAIHGGPDEVFFCGGVLISTNWLLTAAHCVGNRTQPEGWTVKVGVTRRIASPAFVKKLKVRKIIKHPKFNDESLFNNDIALILLEESVEFNQYLRPICLPKANLKLGPDNSRECVVVGFGKSKFSSEANYLHVAHFVNVPIVRHSTCSNWYSEQGVNLTEGMLCAGYAEGKRDACHGDSGSGLFCRYSNTDQFFVAGLVSFGIKCATPKLPGVYTSVPMYVDWVETTARKQGHPLNSEH